MTVNSTREKTLKKNHLPPILQRANLQAKSLNSPIGVHSLLLRIAPHEKWFKYQGNKFFSTGLHSLWKGTKPHFKSENFASLFTMRQFFLKKDSSGSKYI